MTIGSTGRPVQAIQTTCELLEALHERGEAGVTELAESLGVSKGTVHGHLSTLRDCGFVVQRGDSYRLSLRFVDVSERQQQRMDFLEPARVQVRKLAEATGEVAHFLVEERGEGVYLCKATGENAVRTASYVGSRIPLHCTALGKALLAHPSRDRVDEIVECRGLPGVTENTTTEPAELYAELEEIGDRGIAFDDQECTRGLRCVGAPVMRDGGPLGAISVSGPVGRMDDEWLYDELAERVLDAANVAEINIANI